MKSAHKIDAAIETIRRNAGGEMHRCPTCVRPVEQPYLRILDGKIAEGCIDASHGAHLLSSSASGAWHFRPVAVAHRKSTLDWLRSLSA